MKFTEEELGQAILVLTLLIAESKPAEKDTIVQVIVSLINRCNK